MRTRSQPSIVFLCLTLICYFSVYYKFNEFGLYEDDISRFNFYLASDENRFASLKSFINNFTMGRPIGIIFLNYISSYIYDFGGLKGLYLFGLILFSLNSILIFFILKNSFPIYLAIFGSIFFIAFPLDALKPTIVRTFIIQTSFFFAFLSCLIYLYGQKILSYVIFFISLFIYEISIFIFLFAIFFKEEEFKINNLLKHFFICFIVVLFALLVKKYFGNLGRASQFPDLGSFTGYIKIFEACILGFIKSCKILILRPLEIFKFFKIWMIFPIIAFTFVLYFIFFHFTKNENQNFLTDIKKNHFTLVDKKKFILLFFSIFFWFSSYSIMSGHRFGSISREFGRTTSTHLVSYFSIMVSMICIAYLIEKFLVSKHLKKIVKIFLFIYLTLNLSFNLVVQDKMIENWKLSKKQFKFIDENVKDFRDGLVIFVPNLGNKWSYVNSWANFLILKQMYVFPIEWEHIPIAITVNNRNLILRNNKLYIKRAYNRDFEKLDDKNIIVIEYDKKKKKFSRKLATYNIKHLGYKLNLLKKEKINIKKNQHYKIYTQ